MAAPLWTSSDLATISAAIASGALEVRFADRTIRYRSLDDLLKAQTAIQSYLNSQSGAPVVRQHRVVVDKGW